MASLREQIAKLSSTLPEFKDPEDYFQDDTTARLAEKGEEEQDDLPVQSSSLRKKAAVLLDDEDQKYAGKRISRKKLDQFSGIENGQFEEEDYAENDDSLDEVSEDNRDHSSDDLELAGDNSDGEDEEDLEAFQSNFKAATLNDSKHEFSFTDDGDYDKYADDSNEDDDESMDSGDENENEDKDDKHDDYMDDNGDDDGGVKSFSTSSAKEEVQRGESAKQQLGLWDSFLEGRIKLQKVAGIINQLPQFEMWREFEKEGGDAFKQSAAETQAMLKKLLDKLVQLQTILLLQNAETRHLVTGQKPGKVQSNADDDEEIPSDTDDEQVPEKKQEPVHFGVKRKIKMENYPEFLAKRHKDFQTFRNNTIQKWYDKTRLAGGKLKSKSFSSFDQSALKQIEQILGDQDRLVKRTRLKRSVYTILGKAEVEQIAETPSNQEESEILGDNLKSYDPEIFDDNDFYHQQLRELIERKTADVDDPVALSRQWLEIQKLRNKVKKKIDTRASKGRKTRYNVHSKLVNFMAQMDNCSWTDDSKDDLYKSLFGKRFQNSAESVQSTELIQDIS